MEENDMSALDIETAAYEKMRDVLEADHYGEWVVVHGEELVGTYESCEEAVSDAGRRFGYEPCLIKQVGAVITMLPPRYTYGLPGPDGVTPSLRIVTKRIK